MTDPPFQETDNLSTDLEALIHDLGLTPEQQEMLMTRLCSFIIRREHLVYDHGVKIGERRS